MSRRPWWPSLDDLSFTHDMLGNTSLLGLNAEAFRAVVLLASFCGYKSVDLQWSAGNGGWIESGDREIVLVLKIPPKTWSKIKNDVMRFFTVEGERMRVTDERWIKVLTGTIRPPIPASVRSAVMKRDNWTCTYCGTQTGPFDVDHIVPYSRGGSHTDPENLTCACGPCNRAKRANTPSEWIEGNDP